MKIGASMRLFLRENYLKKIHGFYHDDGMIKVITGRPAAAASPALCSASPKI